MAESFIPNPDRLPFVNHKDENPANNTVSNLEWCTAKYNSNYGTCQTRRAKTLSDNLTKKSEIINKYDLSGNFICSYKGKKSIVKAGLRYEAIRRCCNHLQKTAGGYVYRFNGDAFSYEQNKRNNDCCKKRILQFDMKGNFLGSYLGAREASMSVFGKDKILPGISRCCRGDRSSAYGYKWRYA